ncbi:mitochondrial import inner membrane translocase subunit Tim21 [Patella vulgata]|uniref:mitochondrial import inner membrane translocase subunit Tim21 n=1 Tax=Patella vulgata TaxID=6465 RepID=UPI0024A8567D|nr:mitochondrial import inner membrane translocase subunit Tim21 [Patella vulgata]
MFIFIRNSINPIISKLSKVASLSKSELNYVSFSSFNVNTHVRNNHGNKLSNSKLVARNFTTFSYNLQKENKNEIVESKEGAYAGLTLGEKVKEAGKDASYIGVILLGLGVLGVIVYAVGQELFSSSSPSGIYGSALKLCKQNTQIIDALGQPIKGYGETTRRGRRRHVSHLEFMEDGVKHIRMKFYIEGPHKKGTVTLESKQNDRGKYEVCFIYVELDGYPSRVIVVEDNR